ncbi:hypothetical protein ES705_06038 [subsurface metagenome]
MNPAPALRGWMNRSDNREEEENGQDINSRG